LFVSDLFFLDIPSFLRENSASFASYIVQIISICTIWILQPMQIILPPLIY